MGYLLKKYMKPYKWFVTGVVLCVCVQAAAQLLLMSKTKQIIDEGVAKQDMNIIWSTGLFMIFITILTGIALGISSYCSAKAVGRFACDIREALFHAVTKMSAADMNRFGSATLMTRTTVDTISLQTFIINMLRTSMLVPIFMIGILFSTFRLNKPMFLCLAVMFVAALLITVISMTKSVPLFVRLQQNVDHINLLMREKIVGARPIRAFGRQEYEREKFDQAADEAYENAIKANSRLNYISPTVLFCMNIAMVIIYYIGAIQLKQDLVSIATLILFFQYVTYFITCLAIIPVIVNMLPKADVASKRIKEVLEYVPVIQDSKEAETVSQHNGEIVFDHVYFGYQDAEPVISDISFHVKPGATTALIGATGCGKTTLINLLLRMYECSQGSISIEGVDVQKFSTRNLRERISFATQKPQIYQDTIYQNLIMNNPSMTTEKIQAACEAACFEEVLEKQKDGLQTVMSQDGMNLSGGQRQRLSLARTIAKDAEIYIFDDSFSALDLKTEAVARKKIKQLLQNKTILMVAQKINTIMDADEIIVLEQGRICGKGSHEELLANCAVYQDIYKTQCYAEKKDGDFS